MMMTRRPVLIVLFLALCAVGALPRVNAQSSVTFSVFLAVQDADANLVRLGRAPQLDCTDVLYLVVQSESEQAAPLRAYWFGPRGKERVKATREFERNESQWWAWSGLKLDRPAGASVLGLLDTSVGLKEFIGDWYVEVHVGDHRITRLDFTLLC